jgi:hypothetical protein
MSDCSCTGAYPCVGCEADGWPVNPEHLVAYGSPVEPPPVRAYAATSAPVAPPRIRGRGARRGNPPVRPDGVAFGEMGSPLFDRRSTHQGHKRQGGR